MRFLHYSTILFLLLILFFSATTSIFATSSDTLHVGYQKGLNTDLWQGNFLYQKSNFSNYRIMVLEKFSSSRLLLNRDNPKWKDKHQLITQYQRFFLPQLSLDFRGSSFYFSDHQSGYQEGDVSTHGFYSGITYRKEKFRLPAYLGLKEDRRFGQIDYGLHYHISLEIPTFEYSDYNHSLSSQFEMDDFDKRQNKDVGVRYQVSRQFYHETADTLRLRMYEQRRDYYISKTGDVESRQEKVQSADNILGYQLTENMSFLFKGSLSHRTMNISLLTGTAKGMLRKREDFKTTGLFRMRYQNETFSGNLLYSYSSEDQQYDLTEKSDISPYSGTSYLVTPDNQNIRTTLLLRTKWRYNQTDSLLLSSSLQRYRYNTPSDENFDDRDELRIRSFLQSIHYFSSDIRLKFTLSLNMFHFVYIFGEKSADNNWTRILSFKPQMIWKPRPGIRISQTAEVLANYVAYDYEELLPSTRSFLYRKFRLEDSCQVQILPRTQMSLFYRLELDETGKFAWNEWKEQKLTNRLSHSLTFSLRHRLYKRMIVTPGYTLFLRNGYRYQANNLGVFEKNQNLDFQSHGPMLSFMYKGDKLRATLYANTVRVQTLTNAVQIINRLELNMRWFL